MYPNIMDQYWYMLSESEQKVLDYLLRRTFGFQKTKDKIGHGQFVKGIKGYDKGVGLKENAVRSALRMLEQKGFVKIKRSTKESGENEINEYQLVMERKRKGGDKKAPPPGARKALPRGVRKAGTIKSRKINRKINRIIREIHAYYRERINSGARLTDGAIIRIAERLEKGVKFSPEDLKQAIRNFSDDQWWMDHHRKKPMFWFFRYEDRVEGFRLMTPRGYFKEDE